ncbi:MAG: ABC transporter substrate-binding protein [Proteobacteria bacterium]|nr:ABC transporter substrate-binding protein [Pseudomonadota bacterium]
MAAMFKMLNRSCILLVLCVVTATFLASAAWGKEEPKPWEKWDYSKEKPVRGGYYHSASATDVGLLNPNHWPVNDWWVITDFFEKLLTTKGDYLEVPFLLESWEYVDALTVIFKLRKGVTYHDGTVHNAQALKYQMDWIANRNNGCWTRNWLTPLESVEVVDDTTVRFRFNKPWGSFLGIMASVPGFQMSPKSLEADLVLKEANKIQRKLALARKKLKKAEKKARKAEKTGGKAAKKALAKLKKAKRNLANIEKAAADVMEKARILKISDANPVGTAKWILEERRPNNYIKVRRNPNWWYGKSVGHPDMPYFDGKIITVIPDPSIQLANLRAGKIDYAAVATSSVAILKKDPKFNIHIVPNNWSVGLRFNHARPPFNDIRVRKAISHAIDRRALIWGLEHGMARIASCFFPEPHWAHNPDLKPVDYDPELSKRLLAEAGYGEGLTIKGYVGTGTQMIAFGEAVNAMLSKVGVKWEVEALSAVAVDDRIKNLEYDLAGNTYAWMYEPDLCLTNFYDPKASWNLGRSNNKKAVQLIHQGRKESDPVKRRRIYHRIEKLLYDNYEDIWLWWPNSPTVYSKNVRGFVFEGGQLDHKEIWNRTHPLWFKNGREPQR